MRTASVPSSPSGMSRRSLLRSGLVLAGGVGAAGALAACGNSATTADASGTSGGALVGSGKTIALSLNGNNAYTSYVTEGVLKALEGTGYKFIGVQNNFDSSGELGNIQNLLSQGIAGLVVVPTDATTIAKAAQIANKQGVIVGSALWPGPSDADKYFAGVADLDDTAGGKMIGAWLVKNAKPGKTVVVQGQLGQGFTEPLDAGLNAAIAGSGFDVVVREQGFFDRDKATQIVESALQAHPDITAIVSYSASMSDGIAAYLKSIGRTDITHIGDDGDKELFTWLGTPYLHAVRYYSAAQTGLLAAQAVRAKLEGGSPTFRGAVYQAMITKQTAAGAIAKVPYSYPQYAAQAAKI